MYCLSFRNEISPEKFLTQMVKVTNSQGNKSCITHILWFSTEFVKCFPFLISTNEIHVITLKDWDINSQNFPVLLQGIKFMTWKLTGNIRWLLTSVCVWNLLDLVYWMLWCLRMHCCQRNLAVWTLDLYTGVCQLDKEILFCFISMLLGTKINVI